MMFYLKEPPPEQEIPIGEAADRYLAICGWSRAERGYLRGDRMGSTRACVAYQLELDLERAAFVKEHGGWT